MSEVEAVEATDALVPDKQTYYYTFGEGQDAVTLAQKPLSFFGKMEFFSVMGKAIEKVLSEGVSLSELLETPDTSTPLNANSLDDADAFVKAIATAIQYAPEILEDLYCVALGVPRGDREYIKVVLNDNLSDDDGFLILERFVDQNVAVMVGFFTERIIPLVGKITDQFSTSEPSKPSKATRASTPKR